MPVHHMDTEYGRYTIFYVPEKKRANANFNTCLDEEKLAKHLVDSCKALGATQVFLTPFQTNAFQGRTPHYTIDRYEISNGLASNRDYTIEVLTHRKKRKYVRITREATFDVDNMSYTDLEEASFYMKNPESVIGFIRYKRFVIGTFVYTKQEIESIAISKKHRGKGHAYQAIQTLISKMGGKAYLLVSSRNEPALSIYQKMGFVKSSEQSTQWFQLL
jgi:ribosomal protein S18 acetylase RimI-like enzyme